MLIDRRSKTLHKLFQSLHVFSGHFTLMSCCWSSKLETMTTPPSPDQSTPGQIYVDSDIKLYIRLLLWPLQPLFLVKCSIHLRWTSHHVQKHWWELWTPKPDLVQLQNGSKSCPQTRSAQQRKASLSLLIFVRTLPTGSLPCCSGGFVSVPCCRHYWLRGNISQADIQPEPRGVSTPRLLHHRRDTEWRSPCFRRAEKSFGKICHTCLPQPAGFYSAGWKTYWAFLKGWKAQMWQLQIAARNMSRSTS